MNIYIYIYACINIYAVFGRVHVCERPAQVGRRPGLFIDIDIYEDI